MKIMNSRISALAIFCINMTMMWASEALTLPMTGQSIDLNAYASTENAAIENENQIGSTHKGSVITILVNNTVRQDYLLTFKTGAKSLTADYSVEMISAADNSKAMSKNVTIPDTGGWSPTKDNTITVNSLAVGEYKLVLTCISTTASYAGNLGNFGFQSVSCDHIPGLLTTKNITNVNGLKYESGNDNIGYVKAGCSGEYNFICDKAGYYNLDMGLTYYGEGNMTVAVTNNETGLEEARETIAASTEMTDFNAWPVLKYVRLDEGYKTLSVSFDSEQSSWICNFKNINFIYGSDKISKVGDVSVNDQSAKKGLTTDWRIMLPQVYDASTSVNIRPENGTVAVTARDKDGNSVEVTDNGNSTYTLATPAENSSTFLFITLTSSSEDIPLEKEKYSLELFRFGEAVISALSIDDVVVDVPESINTATGKATISGSFTSLPVVKATFVDGTSVSAEGELSGTTATYLIKSSTKTFTLLLDGVHIYQLGAQDQTHTIAPGTGTTSNGIWSDGQVTLNGSGDWAFKLKNGTYTLTMPSNWQVKQVRFRQSADNYASTGLIESLTTDDAEVYAPFNSTLIKGAEKDILFVIENHQKGKELNFTLKDVSQATFKYIDLIYEEKSIDKAPYLTAQSVTSTVGKNHAVVALTFDHSVASAEAVCNENTICGRGAGSTTIYFSVWDLDYSSNYTLTIPAGKLTDNYGNSNTEAIDISFSTGEKQTVDLSIHDYEVSTAEQLRSAVAAANASSQARTVIFVKNGNYDMGSEPLTITGRNIYIIGESRENVLIQGVRDGISNPVVHTSASYGLYLENLTIRNAKNWRMADKGGVGVAINGGTHSIYYHVTLQSNQDTYVSGTSGYLLECDIHGTVDFICGGGDFYFEKCNLILEDRGGNVIVAPNTSAATEWGYVFDRCTVKAADGASQVADYDFSLGRPWQNSPRTYYINTKLEVLPSKAGWRGMSDNLETHFYEYGSVDKNGNLIDLSTRNVEACKSSNGNYTPVLSPEEAAQYTMYNTLGGNDSWNPKDSFADDITTEVTDIRKDSAAEESDDVYNILGQKVTQGYKGMVIQRGKKYLIR